MSEPESERTLEEDILTYGEGDVLSGNDIFYTVQEHSGLKDRHMIRDLTIGVIARMIMEELIIPVKPGGDWAPLPLSAGEVVMKMIDEWEAEREKFPIPAGDGLFMWFENTPKGDEIARAAIGD